jgi:sugar phosphate isomerase/epimerase
MSRSGVRWPLVAMENAFYGDSSYDWPARCRAIADAGYDGVYAVPYPLADEDFSRLRDLAAEPARVGLRVAAVYANLDLAQPADAPANARVTRLFEEVDGVPRIELSVKFNAAAAWPTALEDTLAHRLGPLLAIAARRGIFTALYPHSFYPLATLEQAARLARRFLGAKVGYVYATSHVFAQSTAEGTLNQLEACASEIVSFNI